MDDLRIPTNYRALVYSASGVRVSTVLCLLHLAARREDLASRDTDLTADRCEDCVRNNQLSTVEVVS